MSIQSSAPHYLVLNSGSSTLKYAVYQAQDLTPLERGVFDITPQSYTDTLEEVLHHGGKVTAVGHRVVHGGTRYSRPLVINDDALTALKELNHLAPLHQPHNLHAVETLRDLHPDLPQVACFDTAFHASQPAVVTDYALPASLRCQGLRRYGFHGLSYDYISHQLAALDSASGGRCIVLHLGSGASGCAMLEGKSLSSTMGFTALDGLMMATRSGTLDPGLVLHCITQLGMSAAEVTNLLYKSSGLLGVSERSGDMRFLNQHRDEPTVAHALALYCRSIVRAVGSLTAELQGLDTLVFTAGVGENVPQVRASVCEQLTWLGIQLDTAANHTSQAVISTSSSPVTVRVIHTNEEWMIARYMQQALNETSA